jgi:pyrrolidone-carboxylate peptidase
MILLTGFKGNGNSSKILLDGVTDDNVKKKLLTNSFEVCGKEMIEAVSLLQPEYVISFGRKPVINRLYIEPVACNNGKCIKSAFDIAILEHSLSEHNLQYKLSSKPSNYLCNHAYYCGLNYVEKNILKTKIIFLHVPDMKNIQNMDSLILWLNDLCRKMNDVCSQLANR